MATVASAVFAAAAASTMMDVPESQRLIALSLGKIAASRGQKGGINLHKNLLVATVLTKARAAYMIQHMNAARQRAGHVAAASPPSPLLSSSTTSPSSSLPCVEMKEQQIADQTQAAPSANSTAATTTSTTTTTTPATSSPSPVATPPSSFPLHHSSHSQAAPQSVTPSSTQETPSVPEGAAGTCAMQVAELEDKENTPPPSPCCRDASAPPSSSSSFSQDCEKRLQGDVDSVKEQSKPALSSRPVVSHQTGQQLHNSGTPTPTTRDHASRPSNTSCLLKRRRTMDRDHAENVSAPKVRIVESRVSLDNTTTASTTTTNSPTTTVTVPEPMQCDSPQISNLVNIFNTSFSGLSGAASGGQSLLLSATSHHHHSLSDNSLSFCAKEMKVGGGLDSVHQPSLVLSV